MSTIPLTLALALLSPQDPPSEGPLARQAVVFTLAEGNETAGLTNYYTTNSVTLGGGEAKEIIIDTTGIGAGTYFLYTTNLNYLSNDLEDYGGMMTEIVIL